MALMSPNPALALPSTMWVVYRFLAGGGVPSTDVLVDSVCPPSVRAHGPGRGEATHVRRSLGILMELGMAEADAEGVRITGTPGKWDYHQFIANLRGRIIAPDTPLQREGNDDRPGAADLVRALAWLLTQPTTDLLWWNGNVEARVTRDLFANDTRWNGFQPWALALGFAEEATDPKGQSGIVANPTRAVLDAIKRPIRVKWTQRAEMPAGEFVALLQQEIPVMPGGILADRSMLAESVDGIGAALSFGLLAAEAKKWIRMEAKSDAASVIQVSSSEGTRSLRLVSHVTVLRKQHG